jgi:hypothetical protein
MNRVGIMSQWHGQTDPQAVEDQLLSRIAYYKARLADIQKAPKNSRHREGWEAVASRLEESQYLLAHLRSRRSRSVRPF